MNTAERNEVRLLWANNAPLFALLKLGRFIGPVRRLPKVGWVVTDPILARDVLGDPDHFSIVGEGGVGHLWAQLLGDWVNDAFDGPGHRALRSQGRDLFNDANARKQVARVFAGPAEALREALGRGEIIDIAAVARTWVGRMVADLLGLEVDAGRGDAAYLEIFDYGEQLARLARDSVSSTEMPPEVVAQGKKILEKLTPGIPQAYHTASEDTLMGRCREAGIQLREARGLASLLLVAGTETAASAMMRGVALLHDTGQQRILLDEPDLMAGAVREVLRVATPAPLIGRHVTSDVSVGRKKLRAGERVLMLTYTANNAVGPFNIRRPKPSDIRQLWFGAGPHLCLGAPIARAEMTLLFRTLLANGRPLRVVSRRVARRAIIPSYAELRVALDSGSTVTRAVPDVLANATAVPRER
jgi:cytochrome P450